MRAPAGPGKAASPAQAAEVSSVDGLAQERGAQLEKGEGRPLSCSLVIETQPLELEDLDASCGTPTSVLCDPGDIT